MEPDVAVAEALIVMASPSFAVITVGAVSDTDVVVDADIVYGFQKFPVCTNRPIICRILVKYPLANASFLFSAYIALQNCWLAVVLEAESDMAPTGPTNAAL